MPSARRFRPMYRFPRLRRKRLKRVTWPGGPRQSLCFLALLPGALICALLAGDLARHAGSAGLVVFLLVLVVAVTGLLVRLGLAGLYVGPNHVRICRPLRSRTYLRSSLVGAEARARPGGAGPGIRKRRITVVLQLASGQRVSTAFAVERFYLVAGTPRPLEQYAELRGLLEFLGEGQPTRRP